MNPQTTLFIVSMTGAVGWVLAFIFLAFWLSARERHRALAADHCALKSSHDRVAN